jgi:preprotein translocase subunit SecA
MFKNLFSSLFDSNENQIARLQKTVGKINSLERKYETYSMEDIRAEISSYKKVATEFADKVSLEEKDSLVQYNRNKHSKSENALYSYLREILPNVYAIVREVAKRKYNRRHYDVQLLGGIVLFEGKLAEIKTGEGKTQIAWLPLVLFALTGRGSHLVTVNDYLAKAHGEYSAHLFAELGLTTGITEPHGSYIFVPDEQLERMKGTEVYESRMKLKITNPGDVRGDNLMLVEKKDAYAADILYATNNEIGFDFLRDNMMTKLEERVQRELYFAIVDEVDSILIDEARTPLIISSQANRSTDMYTTFAQIVKQLDLQDYNIDYKARSVLLTDAGIDKVEKLLGVQNVWEDYHMAHHLENALKAEFLFKNDDKYIVHNGEVMIVDEFTGRILPGRRFSEGLHQAIEAKENVEIKKESVTVANTTFQNLFRIYKHLSGMAGTVLTESEEFYKIYNLEVIAVPTNKPVARIDQTDIVYKNQKVKFNAIVDDIVSRHQKGQPVLVGTTSIEKSEQLSALLKARGVKHQVLNAKQNALEAQIIADAGQMGAVTIATNMAGRGTDIKLGDGVAEIGGLYVIGTERHESRRIDNQLRGRSGRQGDAGESRFYLALDDEIMRIQGGLIIQNIMNMTNIDENLPLEAGIIGRTIESAQKKVEGMHFDSRKNVVEYDDVFNKQREIFYTRRRNILRLSEKAQLFSTLENISEKDADTIKITRDAILDRAKNLVLEHFEMLWAMHHEDSLRDTFIREFLNYADDRAILQAFIRVQKKDIELVDLEKELYYLLDESNGEIIFKNILKELIDARADEIGQDKFCQNFISIYIQSQDTLWMEHLEAMTDLKSGIFLNSYAQKDPLIEFKSKGFELFDKYMTEVNSQVATMVLKVDGVTKKEFDISSLFENANEIIDFLAKNNLSVADDGSIQGENVTGALQDVINRKQNKPISQAQLSNQNNSNKQKKDKKKKR